MCKTALPAPYLDLGMQPLANALIGVGFNPQHEEYFPLAVTLCPSCGLSQLTVVVDPEVLYAGYRFRSGASSEWRQHCQRLELEAHRVFKKPGVVIDIAANDGTCLVPFYEAGWHTIGVEPAEITPVRHVGRIERAYWTADVARMLVREHDAADLIIAQNVLGHVDDPVAFLSACELALTPDGFVVVEVPSASDMIRHCAFDTIYHEHLSYWTTGAMERCARLAHLSVHRVEIFPELHGGSRRYWLRRDGNPAGEDVGDSAPVDDAPYQKFAAAVEDRLARVKRSLEIMTEENLRIWAYGASAKGTVMLNALKARGNTIWPEVILDDVPEKAGLLSPGLHIPIRQPDGQWECDVLWILSYNWLDQLRARARDHGYSGKYFVTTPTPHVGEI